MDAIAEATVELADGTPMPALGLGTWELSGTGATDAVLHAIDLGYRMIDAACDYGSEAHIREALERSPVDREELFIVDKVEEDEDSYAAARRRCESLGVESLDLCLIHRPPERGPGLDLWRGLERARADGVTRAIGISNYSPEGTKQLLDGCQEPPLVNQIEWTPFGHSAKVLADARGAGIAVQAYSPLTRGERLDDAELTAIGERHGKTPAQVLLRWNLQLGTVPLPKAISPAHLEENADVFDFELDDREMKGLANLNEHFSALGTLQYL